MRKRASKWEQSGERALLEVWAERMPQLRGCRKNRHVIQEMVAELKQQGFSYSVDELKTKMHNMTTRYRREKQQIRSTGGSPSEWDLYKDMDDLLGPFESNHTQGLVLHSIQYINSNMESASVPLPTPSPKAPSASPPSSLVSISDSSPSTSPNPLRTPVHKKEHNFDKLFRCFEVSMEKMQTTIEKMVAIEEEKKEILKTFVAKEAEVQNALIEFLKKNVSPDPQNPRDLANPDSRDIYFGIQKIQQFDDNFPVSVDCEHCFSSAAYNCK